MRGPWKQGMRLSFHFGIRGSSCKGTRRWKSSKGISSSLWSADVCPPAPRDTHPHGSGPPEGGQDSVCGPPLPPQHPHRVLEYAHGLRVVREVVVELPVPEYSTPEHPTSPGLS